MYLKGKNKRGLRLKHADTPEDQAPKGDLPCPPLPARKEGVTPAKQNPSLILASHRNPHVPPAPCLRAEWEGPAFVSKLPGPGCILGPWLPKGWKLYFGGSAL